MSDDAQDALETSGRAARGFSARTVGGRYRLETVLGRGGMGVVWAGRDLLLSRPVAVKEVVPPHEVDDAARALLRARTLREARTAARISAEGVVAVLDVVEDGGRPWIVMELLAPRTLEDEITSRGGIPPREVAGIGISLLGGLSAAHAAGILHRDIKPSNVMFRDGRRGARAVLADFGIAHVDGDATLTSTGQMMGSPAYMAPERARGEPATAGSDLWSLGVTLWAAVEGWSPFQRVNSLASLTAVITEEPPRAEHAGPLAPVLDGLLRKDPARRIDAATARRLLEDARASRPAPAPAPASEAAGAEPAGVRTTPSREPAPEPTTPPSVPPRAAGGTQPVAVPDDGPDPMSIGEHDVVHDDAPGLEVPPWWAPAPEPAVMEAGPRPGRRRRLLVAAAVTLGLVGVGATLLEVQADAGRGAAGTAGTASVAEGRDTASAANGDVQPEGTAAEGATGADGSASGDSGDTGEGAAEQGGEDQGAGGQGSADAGGDGPAADGAAGADEVTAPDAAPPVPEGFQRHTDPTGFTVDVPAGWQVEREGPRVYLRDPASAAYLLVDQTDTPGPDPVADWQGQEPAVARRLAGYTRIGEIEPIDYRGWEAADWEFVFGPGQRTHVLNRNVITSPDQAYALYWSVPSARWDAMLPVHEKVLASFQPAG